MFERYTEKARRSIFFARYEAGNFGSSYIETQHLLLGLLREDKTLAVRFLRSQTTIESIRKQIEANTPKGEKFSTSVDIPMSQESKRALAYGAEEAERLKQQHIGTNHIFLGLLREKESYAAELLRERGLSVNVVREELARESVDQETEPEAALAPYITDVTKRTPLAASPLDPTVDRVIEILWRQSKNFPVLIVDEPSRAGAVVERFASRIQTQNVPEFFFGVTVLSVDIARFASENAESASPKALAGAVIKFLQPHRTVCFLNGRLEVVVTLASHLPNVANSEPKYARRQFICLATPEEFRKYIESHPLLKRRFEAVEVNVE